MFKFFAAFFLATQALVADVIISDAQNRRYLVVYVESPTLAVMKSCLSIPDQGRPRTCEHQNEIPTTFSSLMRNADRALLSKLNVQSLSEVSHGLERVQNQMNAKRVMNLSALEKQKEELLVAQSRLMTLMRFQKGLEKEDFEIDVLSANPDENILANSVSSDFDLGAMSQANLGTPIRRGFKTSVGPEAGSRYFSGWLDVKGFKKHLTGFYSFNFKPNDAGVVLYRENEKGQATESTQLTCETTNQKLICRQKRGGQSTYIWINPGWTTVLVSGEVLGAIEESYTGRIR